MTAPATRRQMDTQMLIALWRDRLNVARADERVPLGCVADLIAETIPRLQRLQLLEADR